MAQKERKRNVGQIVNDRDVMGRQLIEKQLEVRQLGREKHSLESDSSALRREVDAKLAHIDSLSQHIKELTRQKDILARKAIKGGGNNTYSTQYTAFIQAKIGKAPILSVFSSFRLFWKLHALQQGSWH